MLFRLLLTTMILLFIPMPQTQAQDTSTQAASTPLDLIELLGEIDDEDTESLDAAISQVEIKSGQAKAYPQELKK